MTSCATVLDRNMAKRPACGKTSTTWPEGGVRRRAPPLLSRLSRTQPAEDANCVCTGDDAAALRPGRITHTHTHSGQRQRHSAQDLLLLSVLMDRASRAECQKRAQETYALSSFPCPMVMYPRLLSHGAVRGAGSAHAAEHLSAGVAHTAAAGFHCLHCAWFTILKLGAGRWLAIANTPGLAPKEDSTNNSVEVQHTATQHHSHDSHSTTVMTARAQVATQGCRTV